MIDSMWAVEMPVGNSLSTRTHQTRLDMAYKVDIDVVVKHRWAQDKVFLPCTLELEPGPGPGICYRMAEIGSCKGRKQLE